MVFKSISLVVISIMLSSNVNATLIDNGIFTSDTATGLDWLDLTETSGPRDGEPRGFSADDVLGQLGAGGQFEGWRYANFVEVHQLMENAGHPFAQVHFL